MGYKDLSKRFTPIHINADILESNKLLALYMFTGIFLPNMGSNILNILLDMEKHSKKMIAAVKPEKREELIHDLEGVTVEIRYLIKDRGEELLALPINISPSDVLRNATLVKPGLRYTKKMQKEINKMLLSLIKKEIQRRIKTIIEKSLKTFLAKPRMPAAVKKLLSLNLIDREGRLAEGTTIEDLVSGRNVKLFKKVIPENLINEALVIKETIKACYDWNGEDYQSLITEALIEKRILEITLQEMKS